MQTLAEWTDTAGPEGGEEYLSLPHGWAIDRRGSERSDRARSTHAAGAGTPHDASASTLPAPEPRTTVVDTPLSTPVAVAPPPPGRTSGEAPSTTESTPPPGVTSGGGDAPPLSAAPPSFAPPAGQASDAGGGGGGFTEDAFSAPPPPDFGPPPPDAGAPPPVAVHDFPKKQHAASASNPLVSAALIAGAIKLLTLFL